MALNMRSPWWCPTCDQLRPGSEAACPVCGALAKSVRWPAASQLLPARPPGEEESFTGVILEEREPVEAGRSLPWSLWLLAGAVAVGIGEALVRALAARPAILIVVAAAAVLAALAVFGGLRLLPAATRRIMRPAIGPLAAAARPFLPRQRLRRRLIVQRLPEGDLLGVEIDAPAPWPPEGRELPLTFRGAWRRREPVPVFLAAEIAGEPAAPPLVREGGQGLGPGWALAAFALYLFLGALVHL